MLRSYLHHVSKTVYFRVVRSLGVAKHTASAQGETVLQYFYKDLNLKAQ